MARKTKSEQAEAGASPAPATPPAGASKAADESPGTTRKGPPAAGSDSGTKGAGSAG